MSIEKSETRVGFLLINTPAHLYFAATIAFELSYNKKFRVLLYISTNENKELLEKLSKKFPGHQCEYVFLTPPFLQRILRVFKKRLHPRVRDVLTHNKKLLFQDDALVMTEKHMLNIQGDNKPKYIFTGHGPGDRAYGFTPKYKDFDYLLVYGQSKWNRLENAGLVSPERGKIVGYPKFDSIPDTNTISKLFANDKPIALYNPHFNPNEGSWQSWGEEILEYFYHNKNFNLIFAPHIMLFAKKRNGIATKFNEAENIHIDLGSHKLTDMSYTRIADIYLGDVSSQVYEFIGYRERPCVFLNPHQESWIGNINFRMWNMGDVVSSMDNFDYIINNAQSQFSIYKTVQEYYSKEEFSRSEITASKRAATAVIDFMQKE